MVFGYLYRKIKKLVNTVAKIPQMIANAIKRAIEKLFRKPLDGILRMIENFKRILCFLNSLGVRSRNIIAGIDNIFKGIGAQYAAIGQSIYEGGASTGKTAYYGAEYIGSRARCIVKFIGNFYKCFFFYILSAFYGILYVILVEPTRFLGNLIGLDMDRKIEQMGNGIIEIDAFFYSIFNFHLIYFPESVRKDCYTCVRLKDSAMANQANELKWTFEERIPYIMKEKGAAPYWRRADNQFKEVSVLVPRTPDKVH
jgi:hypothetical protein